MSSGKENRTQRRIQELETKLERLSDLSHTLEDVSLERKQNGFYHISLAREDYFLICEAVKKSLLSTAHDMQAASKSEDSKASQEEPLTADDITDLREIHSEYYGSSRTATHIFTCNIQGEPDILTYEVSLHDDDVEGFTIHTEKNDIWDNWDKRMGWKELAKLERKIKSEAAFGWYVREIRLTQSLSDLTSLLYSFWDDEDPYLMPEQRQEISDMIDEKREDLRNAPFFAENEDLLFDLTDTTDRYAIYQISDDSMGRDHSYSFMGMEFVKEHGMEVKGMDYDMVYGGVLKTEEDFEPGGAFEPMQELDQIYVKFNLERPQDFTGHSLSVSDVVMLKHDGETKAYYVDSSGFVELPDFVQERQTIAANVCRNRADAEKAKEFPLDQEVQAQNPRPMKRKR